MCSKVGDIVNMYGVSEDRRDRCRRSARQLVTLCLFISCNDEKEKKTSNAARNVSTKENFVVQEVAHTVVSELWRPQRHMVLVTGVEKKRVRRETPHRGIWPFGVRRTDLSLNPVPSLVSSITTNCMEVVPPTDRVIQNDCRGFNNLSYTIHLI